MGIGTWILVSDACHARVFADRGLREGLVELEGFNLPGGREHVRDRVADRSGLKPAGAHGVRSGATQEVDPKEADARLFARYLADCLKKKLDRQAFDGLLLVAPPHFLGLLKAALDDTVARCLLTTFSKDYTALDPAELARRIHATVR